MPGLFPSFFSCLGRTQNCPLFAAGVFSPGMTTGPSDDLFPDVQNPEGTLFINDRCMVKTQGDQRVVIFSGVAVAQYKLSDRLAEAYAMVNLVDQRWADQNDVARAFGCSARTLRR
jgi:hypothetical protein